MQTLQLMVKIQIYFLRIQNKTRNSATTAAIQYSTSGPTNKIRQKKKGLQNKKEILQNGVKSNSLLPTKDNFEQKHMDWMKVIGWKKIYSINSSIRRLKGHISICSNRLQDKDHYQRQRHFITIEHSIIRNTSQS